MGTQERTLLLVDDEENILQTMRRLYRRNGYRILTASSGKEGLEILKENQVGVIVSDQRMPEMSGVEFLSEVKVLYPETIRIVLSGYTELESVTDAVNRGAIYKFLTKPWNDEVLRDHIEEAFVNYELTHENKRLTSDLKCSNDLLKDANKELENYAIFNFKLLQISQELLENLPVGIVGIGDDSVIAIANKKAHEIFCSATRGLVGTACSEVLPPQLNEFYRMKMNEQEIATWAGVIPGVGEMQVILSHMGLSSMSDGIVLAFIAQETGGGRELR